MKNNKSQKDMINLKQVGLFVDPKNRNEISSILNQWANINQIQITWLDWNSEKSSKFDLIIVFGGDGTVLFTLGHFSECPILAINYGNVGFLTASHKNDLNHALERLIQNEYIISERSMLECSYQGKVSYAVNEIVIKGVANLISINLFINGNPIRKIRGDGVIVGTSTGSTAYLLSTGSPIVMPEVNCMIVSGLNEYNFTARNLIVSANAHIKLKIDEDTHEREIYLSIDGKGKVPLHIDEEIIIQESQRRAKLIFLEENYFFNNLSSRLSW